MGRTRTPLSCAGPHTPPAHAPPAMPCQPEGPAQPEGVSLAVVAQATEEEVSAAIDVAVQIGLEGVRQLARLEGR